MWIVVCWYCDDIVFGWLIVVVIVIFWFFWIMMGNIGCIICCVVWGEEICWYEVVCGCCEDCCGIWEVNVNCVWGCCIYWFVRVGEVVWGGVGGVCEWLCCLIIDDVMFLERVL